MEPADLVLDRLATVATPDVLDRDAAIAAHGGRIAERDRATAGRAALEHEMAAAREQAESALADKEDVLSELSALRERLEAADREAAQR